MKLEISTGKLLKLLTNLAPIARRTSSFPILGHALLKGNGETMDASATDLTISWKERIECLAEGESLIPIGPMLSLVKQLPGDWPITITSDDGGTVTLRYPDGKYCVSVPDVKDYPVLPSATSDPVIIEDSILADLISRVRYAAAKSDVRPYLNGILINGEDGCLTVVGTDGHRMSMAWSPVNISCNAIIPNDAVDRILKLLGDVSLSIDAGALTARTKDVELTTKLVDGKYADWKKAIPQNNDKTLEIEQSILLGQLKRLVAVTPALHGFVPATLSMRGGRVAVKTNVTSFSLHRLKEFEEVREAVYHGDAMEIGVNAEYLISALESHGVGLMKMSFSKPDRPILIEDTLGLHVLASARV